MVKKSVSLVIADTESYVLANNAIQHCVNFFDFKQIIIFTDKPDYWPQHTTIKIPKITNIDDYNNIILRDLPQHIKTDLAIITQFDGFILNPDAFNDIFYNYDYIGALWPNCSENRVGNGGFSWRSRRLIDATSQYLNMRTSMEAEDVFVCRHIRSILEGKHGCIFAEDGVADLFSHEMTQASNVPFGFHGVFHLPAIYKENPEFLINNLPDRVIKHQKGLLYYGIQKLDISTQIRYTELLQNKLSAMGL